MMIDMKSFLQNKGVAEKSQHDPESTHLPQDRGDCAPDYCECKSEKLCNARKKSNRFDFEDEQSVCVQ